MEGKIEEEEIFESLPRQDHVRKYKYKTIHLIFLLLTSFGQSIILIKENAFDLWYQNP